MCTRDGHAGTRGEDAVYTPGGPERTGPPLPMCPLCWPRYGPPGGDSPLFCVCQTASATPQSPENTKNTASWRGSGLHSKRVTLQDRWVTAPAGAEGGNRPEVSAAPGRRGPGDAQGASCLLLCVSNVPGNAPNRPPPLDADPERAGRPGAPFTAPRRRPLGGGAALPTFAPTPSAGLGHKPLDRAGGLLVLQTRRPQSDRRGGLLTPGLAVSAGGGGRRWAPQQVRM